MTGVQTCALPICTRPKTRSSAFPTGGRRSPTPSCNALGECRWRKCSVSCHLDLVRREGQIGLVGVGPEVRGRGIGKNLVLAAIDWFRTQGVHEVTVVTQGNNRAAQRL